MKLLSLTDKIDIAGAKAQGVAIAEPTRILHNIWIATFKDCEGKDSANYTRVGVQETSIQCSDHSKDKTVSHHWIVSEPNGKHSIINVVTLASSLYPSGGKTAPK